VLDYSGDGVRTALMGSRSRLGFLGFLENFMAIGSAAPAAAAAATDAAAVNPEDAPSGRTPVAWSARLFGVRLHDCEDGDRFGAAVAVGGALDALVELRRNGQVGEIGTLPFPFSKRAVRTTPVVQNSNTIIFIFILNPGDARFVRFFETIVASDSPRRTLEVVLSLVFVAKVAIAFFGLIRDAYR
jgi:hypothetical protein